MNGLQIYLVETPIGEIFRIYAANEYDAGMQVLRRLKLKNSICPKGRLIYNE
jgi:hypothetical protein